MNNGLNANEPRDIGGSQLLGRGLNRLDWAGDNKECQKVGDTESGKRAVTYKQTSYNVGKNVTMSTVVSQDNFATETFSSRDEYEKHTQSSVEAAGKYGAFSAGFKATFGSDIKTFEEREAALYSHTARLWKLTLEVNPANTTEAFKKRITELPKTFDANQPKPFFDFFVDFGVDIVSEVTVGGSLNYAMTALKSYLSQTNTLDAMLKAEYGAFVSGSASTSISETVKKNLAHRNANLTTQGGTYSIRFNAVDPSNCNDDFTKWRESLADDPKVVELQLSPVYRFVNSGETRTALEQAYQWYTSYKAEIEANWQESTIVLGRADRLKASLAPSGPALRMVWVDNQSKETSESFHKPPAADASTDDFEQFWDALALLIKQKTGHKLLMATERWPREKRYYPTRAMRESLLLNGASDKALKRWEALTKYVQPNPLAGLTYVLAGNNFNEPGVDGLIAGFGQAGTDLNPTVKVRARLCHDSFGRVKVVQTEKTEEDPCTVLYIVRNNTGDKPALATDPQNKTRIAMEAPDKRNLGQFWYMPELEKPYPDINHPVLLINYETGTCLQGMHDQNDCRLKPIEPGRQQDDVIWDRRGDDVFHLLLVHYKGNNMCLTQIEKRAAVRPWRQPHGLDWLREQHRPYS
ncbi:MACPF domain-containing protein [Pseudomonas citri]|uniref:MACPF domain-containing protein n=1 Tax=Pseudomonas citri TaxID=2978349 RepID=UPI0021B60BDA|nr:MACPF domain-containing protein [Pseudomonas citri]